MQQVVVMSQNRAMMVIPAPLPAAAPLPAGGTPAYPFSAGDGQPGVSADRAGGAVVATPGLYSVFGGLIAQSNSDQGIPRLIRVLPCRSQAAGSYTLTVYGWVLVGSRWHAILLFSGVCNCTFVNVDPQASPDSIQNGDTLATTITPAAGSADNTAVVSDNANPASAIIQTQGCPYVTFASSDASAYVAVSPVS